LYICFDLTKKTFEMKKVLFVAAAGLVLFASCRKTRTCTCTSATGGSYVETYAFSTKKNAKAYCDAEQGVGYSCELN
jgi:hypothetical protein